MTPVSTLPPVSREDRGPIIPLHGGTALLPRLVGESRALEMMLSGDPVDAERALAWGLVSRICASAASLLNEACALAERCSRHSMVPQRAIRVLLRDRSAQQGLAETLQAELRAGQEVSTSEDAIEGLRAFTEKRPAVFKDR